MYNKQTYTAGKLKENIYKALGEYSINGTENSFASGSAADMEKKYITALNICLRRVTLSLPLLENKAEISFVGNTAALPEDCGKVTELYVEGVGKISQSRYCIFGTELECTAAKDADSGVISYTVMPDAFTPETPADSPVKLPDITADALVYLTASELCPAEYSELYSKLLYKYRDIALNCYNSEKNQKPRNKFFSSRKRTLRRY